MRYFVYLWPHSQTSPRDQHDVLPLWSQQDLNRVTAALISHPWAPSPSHSDHLHWFVLLHLLAGWGFGKSEDFILEWIEWKSNCQPLDSQSIHLVIVASSLSQPKGTWTGNLLHHRPPSVMCDDQTGSLLLSFSSFLFCFFYVQSFFFYYQHLDDLFYLFSSSNSTYSIILVVLLLWVRLLLLLLQSSSFNSFLIFFLSGIYSFSHHFYI